MKLLNNKCKNSKLTSLENRPSSMTTSAQTIQTNNEALIDAISLVEDNGYVKTSYKD